MYTINVHKNVHNICASKMYIKSQVYVEVRAWKRREDIRKAEKMRYDK